MCHGNVKGLSAEQKVREQNRIRQFAYKVREKMPKDYESYCLVAAHLVKNAYRYKKENEEIGEVKFEVKSENDIETSAKCEVKQQNIAPQAINTFSQCQEVNKILREIRTLKRHNRIREQQEKVQKLKTFGSYRELSRLAGIALKTVHGWCSPPKDRKHKGTSRANLRKEEFINFLMQDTISYANPCKKYAGKRFLLHTWNEIYDRYLQTEDYHQHGILSKSTLRSYKPKYFFLAGSTPLNQCLCDYCENCDLICRALSGVGVQGIPGNKYSAVDSTLCGLRTGMFGTGYAFAHHSCVMRNCEDCGKNKLKVVIEELNKELLELNRPMTWHRWKVVEGRSAPQKCEIKGTLRQGVEEFLSILEDISDHLFRANWNRNVFDYIKQNLQVGYLLQVMDFAMNFNNWYQDEVQSAYWTGTQTTIHATVNFFKCLRDGCQEIVTLALVHITDDMKHDSFLSRAAQIMTFNYLASLGIPMDLVLQFCDNCAAQYKSRRPFVELAKCALEVIRVYFGEKHGKSHADGLFGRLKSWMTYNIKTRRFIVSDARSFFNYCREFYQTPRLEGCCQHYRVEFEFIRPCDVRRHHDADLDQAVPQTQELYSVRNTAEPLQLKVRSVPCLCPPCIKDEGECLNYSHTDPWRLVNLIPSKGANKRKYQKRKSPFELQNARRNEVSQSRQPALSVTEPAEPVQEIDADAQTNERETEERSGDVESDGDVLPEISIDFNIEEIKKRRRRRALLNKKSENIVTDRVTDSMENEVGNMECRWRNEDEEIIEIGYVGPSSNVQDTEEYQNVEVIDLCAKASKEFELAGENMMDVSVTESVNFQDLLKKDVPEYVLWISILSGCQSCTDFRKLKKMINDLTQYLPPLKPRVNCEYQPNIDVVDRGAKLQIPKDGPTMLTPVQIYGDGNCLPRALGKAYYNDESTHPEIRARILFEGVTNMDHYLSDDCLERGAFHIHRNADLPTVFATFSDYYTPGQRFTENTIHYIYVSEMYGCSRLGNYMGLWQLAQASSVFGIPIHTIYPVLGESTLRNDFHRIFFPVEYPPEGDDEHIVIMWTGKRRGAIPNHFVPLLKNAQ